MDCSPPGSSVHGILQARIQIPMSSSRGSSWPRDSTLYSLCNVLVFLCLWKFSLLSTLLYLTLTYAFILLFSKYPCHYWISWAFLVAQRVRDPPALQRAGFSPWVEEDMGICILAWRIPWTVQPDGLLSMGSHRVRHSLATKAPPGVPSHVFLGRNSPTQAAFWG